MAESCNAQRIDIVTDQYTELSIKSPRGRSKSTFVEEGKGGGHWKANKNKQGEGGGGVLACVYVRFLKKKYRDFQNEVL